MPKKSAYTDESITMLKGADRVRKRPGVIFGSDDAEGCAHGIFEIISNSVDEAREGYGDRILITKFRDGSVEVEDFGRGMPVEFNKAQNRYNWDLLFCEMYAGGKYSGASENYEYSLGLNGLGLCATQYASAWMTADIYRDGMHYHLDFKKGENVGGLQKEPTTRRKTGSAIRWKPDDEVFTDTNVPSSYFVDVIKRQAVVNAGITFVFTDETAEGGKTVTEFFYQNGISDYVDELAAGESLTPVRFVQSEATGRDREDRPEYKVKMSAAFCFSNKTQLMEYYHNSSWLEHGGSPERAARTAFLYQIDAYLKAKNMYKKNERISYQDVQDCLIFVSSSFSTLTSYENQTKKAVTNKFIQQAMTDFLKHSLEVYFLEKPDEAQRVAQQVLVNMQSRMHAEQTRLGVKKALTAQIDIANRVQKFVDCRSKDPAKREVYIVEGDSALGAVKTSRDSEYQAIMPVRGKILNCLKADYARIFKSDIITDLIKVLGCGVELSGGKGRRDLSSFDLANLRWSKIVICTDADVDGYQIRTLILTMLYRLVPTLIDEGYVYIAESPLYEIESRGRTFFAYTEPEKTEFLAKIGQDKYTIQRSKGLGENDPEMMWLTTMNPESRRLIKVMPADAKRTAEVFDLLLGDDLAGRKEHIATEGYKYLDELDVS